MCIIKRRGVSGIRRPPEAPLFVPEPESSALCSIGRSLPLPLLLFPSRRSFHVNWLVRRTRKRIPPLLVRARAPFSPLVLGYPLYARSAIVSLSCSGATSISRASSRSLAVAILSTSSGNDSSYFSGRANTFSSYSVCTSGRVK